MEPLLAREDAAELAQALVQQGVPCAPVQNVAQVLESEQARASGAVVALDNGYKGIASPIRLSATPATYRLPPPPFPESGAVA
nr:CoA transferase [Diaphorobacter sp.]